MFASNLVQDNLYFSYNHDFETEIRTFGSQCRRVRLLSPSLETIFVVNFSEGGAIFSKATDSFSLRALVPPIQGAGNFRGSRWILGVLGGIPWLGAPKITLWGASGLCWAPSPPIPCVKAVNA